MLSEKLRENNFMLFLRLEAGREKSEAIIELISTISFYFKYIILFLRVEEYLFT